MDLHLVGSCGYEARVASRIIFNARHLNKTTAQMRTNAHTHTRKRTQRLKVQDTVGVDVDGGGGGDCDVAAV